jgi:hypothetical protein
MHELLLGLLEIRPALLISEAVSTARAIPPALQKPSVEIGDYIKSLVQRASRPMEFSDGDDNIVWLQSTPQEGSWNGSTRRYRKGLLHVNALGKTFVDVEAPSTEVPWTISYSAVGTAPGPVQEIKLEPYSRCFGSRTGCDFPIEPSLEKAGLKYTSLCRTKLFSADYEEYFRIDSGKEAFTLRYMYSAGSGGASSEVALLVKDSPLGKCGEAAEECCLK